MSWLEIIGTSALITLGIGCFIQIITTISQSNINEERIIKLCKEVNDLRHMIQDKK